MGMRGSVGDELLEAAFDRVGWEVCGAEDDIGEFGKAGKRMRPPVW